MRRLAIYAFWEEKGIVKDFIIYYLKELYKVADDVWIVVNGKLSAEGRDCLENIGVKVIVRQNRGFDFWAWKKGLEYFSWDKVIEYDELILANSSCYGPLYPFSILFNEMVERDCDFWGITKHPKVNKKFIQHKKSTIIFEHIQSYFIVFRSRILRAHEFKHYWDNLKDVNSFEEAIAFFEIQLTRYFESKGFKWDVYINTPSKTGKNDTYFVANEQIINQRNPLVKRKIFLFDTSEYLNISMNHSNRDVMEYIKTNTNYDINFIIDDLLAQSKVDTLLYNLQLSYILSSKTKSNPTSIKFKPKIALILNIAYNVEYFFNYAKNVPKEVDIFIGVKDKKIVEKAEVRYLPNKMEFRIIPQAELESSGLINIYKDIINNYDYICFACDVENNGKQVLINEEISYHYLESVLHNKVYVYNIIETFNAHPRLGLLVPFSLLWCHKDSKIKRFFWFRGKALKTLSEYEKLEGCIFQKELLYSNLAKEGYYPALVCPDTYACIYMNNLCFKFEERMCRKPIKINMYHFCKFFILSKIMFTKRKRNHYKAKMKRLKFK